MKNCKLLSHQYNDVALGDGEMLLLCVQCTLDVLCAVTSKGRIVQFTWRQEVRILTSALVHGSSTAVIVLIDHHIVQASLAEVQTAVDLPLSDGAAVTCLAYLAEQEICLIGTSQGSLMTFDGDSGAEPVGTMDSAVLAIAVSPDGQLIAILTGSGQLLLMNPFWEVEAETSVQVGLEGGQPVVHEVSAAFAPGSAAIIWRGDSRFLASVTQSSDECALPAVSSLLHVEASWMAVLLR
jgi:hypothetical protein